MGKVLLEKMKFHAFHGVYPQERIIGGEFMVDLTLELSFGDAALTDQLADTLNYEQVYEVVKEEMMRPSNLLEHVVERIGNRILLTFPAVQSVETKVSKCHPAMGGDIGLVSVVDEKRR
ncbi:MAG: dihydroneopterin aldolase [Microbacter sp.]